MPVKLPPLQVVVSLEQIGLISCPVPAIGYKVALNDP